MEASSQSETNDEYKLCFTSRFRKRNFPSLTPLSLPSYLCRFLDIFQSAWSPSCELFLNESPRESCLRGVEVKVEFLFQKAAFQYRSDLCSVHYQTRCIGKWKIEIYSTPTVLIATFEVYQPSVSSRKYELRQLILSWFLCYLNLLTVFQEVNYVMCQVFRKHRCNIWPVLPEIFKIKCVV